MSKTIIYNMGAAGSLMAQWLPYQLTGCMKDSDNEMKKNRGSYVEY